MPKATQVRDDGSTVAAPLAVSATPRPEPRVEVTIRTLTPLERPVALAPSRPFTDAGEPPARPSDAPPAVARPVAPKTESEAAVAAADEPISIERVERLEMANERTAVPAPAGVTTSVAIERPRRRGAPDAGPLAARDFGSEAAPVHVEISIGRIEVTAAAAPPVAPRPPAPHASATPLERILERRRGDRS
jgi:hypothetical protein